MRVKRTKKQPLASSAAAFSQPSSSHATAVVSRRVTQATISKFHTLLKRQTALKRQLKDTEQSSAQHTIQKSLEVIEGEIEALGGLNAYQKASTLGQSKERGGDSSKILVDWFNEMGLAGKGKQKMLEIGALRPDNYESSSSWIDNHPIDLHSQHPDIVEQDFFARPLPASAAEAFDIVSCSLVLNFVSAPVDRGRMLQLMHSQLKPSATSLLFLVLPLPCLSNSRYTSISSFTSLMSEVGFELVKERWKLGGKVGYWLWRWKEPSSGSGDKRWRKKMIETDGPKRNNFAVVLP